MKRVSGLLIIFLLALLWVDESDAATYYVKKTGNNANSCATAQNEGTPKLTLHSAMACVAAGDTLDIGVGTYVEAINCDIGNACPVTGTATNPITIRGHAGETVTLKPSGSGIDVVYINNNKGYITLDNLVLDGGSQALNGSPSSSDIVAIDCDGQGNNCAHHVTVQNSILRDSTNNCILTGTNATFNVFRNNEIHSCGVRDTAYNVHRACYITGSDNIVEHNHIHSSQSGCGAYTAAPVATTSRNTFRYNYVHDIAAGTGTGTGGVGLDASRGSNNVIHNNLVRNVRFAGISVHASASGTKVYNNTVADVTSNGYCVTHAGSITGTLVKNNLCNGTTGMNVVSGAGVTFDNNLCPSSGTGCEIIQSNAALIFTNKAGLDFTLISGSPAINAGVVITDNTCTANNCGSTFNGSAPEIGMFELPVPVSCSVADGDADTVRLVWGINTPIFQSLQNCLHTNFAAVVGGAGATESSCTVAAANRTDINLGTNVTNGQSVTLAYTKGTLSDNARVGAGPAIGTGLTNRNSLPLSFTALTCTNNVGAASTATWTQDAMRVVRFTESEVVTSPIWNDEYPLNSDLTMRPGAKFSLISGLACSVANCPATSFKLRASVNGAAYEDIAATCATADVCFRDAPNLTEGDSTTQQLAIADFVAGAVVESAGVIPTLTFTTGQRSELRFGLALKPTIAADTTVAFRLYDGANVALNGGYTETLTVTAGSTVSGRQ